jgi:protein TonB
MKKIFLFSFLIFSVCGFSQNKTDKSSNDKQNMTVTASQDAFYPKGEQALYNYVLMNAKYSEEAKKNFVTGDVELSFDVMPDSSVTNVKVIHDVGFGVGDEVKKIVSQLKFAPAIMMGVKVRTNVMMDFPVKAH